MALQMTAITRERSSAGMLDKLKRAIRFLWHVLAAHLFDYVLSQLGIYKWTVAAVCSLGTYLWAMYDQLPGVWAFIAMLAAFSSILSALDKVIRLLGWKPREPVAKPAVNAANQPALFDIIEELWHKERDASIACRNGDALNELVSQRMRDEYDALLKRADTVLTNHNLEATRDFIVDFCEYLAHDVTKGTIYYLFRFLTLTLKNELRRKAAAA